MTSDLIIHVILPREFCGAEGEAFENTRRFADLWDLTVIMHPPPPPRKSSAIAALVDWEFSQAKFSGEDIFDKMFTTVHNCSSHWYLVTNSALAYSAQLIRIHSIGWIHM